jgi:hypothetical protein
MNNGGIVTIAVLLPNLLWVLFPPPSKQAGETNPTDPPNQVMQILERVGQFGCFLLPFFYNLRIQTAPDFLFLIILLAALAIYYVCWIRYFFKGRQQVWLNRNLGPLPLTLSICPVLCFLSASIPFHSILLAAAAVILGIGHIYMGIIEPEQAEQLYGGMST